MPDRDPAPGQQAYRERLHVPWVWWLLAVVFALSMLAAFGFYLGPVWGVAVAALSLIVAVAIFASAGLTIIVDTDGLRVGRAFLDYPHLGRCHALDAEDTSLRSGTGALATAHLVLRPYVATAVELTLDDADDPVPYWLVSTRHPARLTTAVEGARARYVDHLGSPGD